MYLGRPAVVYERQADELPDGTVEAEHLVGYQAIKHRALRLTAEGWTFVCSLFGITLTLVRYKGPNGPPRL